MRFSAVAKSLAQRTNIRCLPNIGFWSDLAFGDKAVRLLVWMGKGIKVLYGGFAKIRSFVFYGTDHSKTTQ